jgi:hypothetical protein
VLYQFTIQKEKDEIEMINHHRRLFARRHLCKAKCCFIGLIIIILSISLTNILRQHKYIEIGNAKHRVKISLQTLELYENQSNYTYETFTQWNRSLCSIQSDHRGPHQKVIALSIYGSTSNYTDNPMYSWDRSILSFLEPLANEVKLLLPSWIIRIYIDFTGSTKAQRDFLYKFSNIDICDMKDLPLFGSSLLTFLPGKMWRFVPIFDPYVDYTLSRDLDSPIIQRETETIDMWISDEQEDYFFYIARDHNEHGRAILGGLWGAATKRARYSLFAFFYPILMPSIARLYTGAGDQQFVSDFVWPKVKQRSLSFDSHFCQKYGSRPFLSQRPKGNCYLGCVRPCCDNTTRNENSNKYMKPCPVECRPKDHQDWIYC